MPFSKRQVKTFRARPSCVTRVRSQDTDRAGQIALLNSRAAELAGLWVAVGSGGIIASDASLKNLMVKVKESGVQELPLIHRMEAVTRNA